MTRGSFADNHRKLLNGGRKRIGFGIEDSSSFKSLTCYEGKQLEVDNMIITAFSHTILHSTADI